MKDPDYIILIKDALISEYGKHAARVIIKHLKKDIKGSY